MIKKKKQVNPEHKQVLLELEDIVQRVGYKVRYEKGDFEGGYCIIRESQLFVINSRNDVEKRISIICRNLKELGIEGVFIKPQIREIIEKETVIKKAETDNKEEK
jgi:hypothetical protein